MRAFLILLMVGVVTDHQLKIIHCTSSLCLLPIGSLESRRQAHKECKGRCQHRPEAKCMLIIFKQATPLSPGLHFSVTVNVFLLTFEKPYFKTLEFNGIVLTSIEPTNP